MPDPCLVSAPVQASSRIPLWGWLLMAAALMAVAACLELAQGRTLISTSGTIWLWVNDINSAETSQQLLDWYSFTHILHGVIL